MIVTRVYLYYIKNDYSPQPNGGGYWSYRLTISYYARESSLWVPGGERSQGWNLKQFTEGHHQEWSLRLNLTQHGETYQVQT